MSSRDDLPSTPRYDRILAASRSVAFGLGHRYVGVEHLFLAMVQDRAAVPTQILSRFVDPQEVGEAVRTLITSDDWGRRGPDPR
jgi:ATP-dependent Clp protease ATP-binding subunit ClpA